MHSFTTAYKRIKCDVCEKKTLSSVTKLDDGEYALAVPLDWRLIWNRDERELKFRCGECWETFAMTLEDDGSVV